MIRGVIFDLDGVLVTTDEFHYQGWARLAREEGIPFDRDINQRLRGVSRMDSLAIMLEKADRTYTEEEKLAMAERKNAYYRDSLKNLSPDDALPGAREMLKALRERGIKIGIGSSSKNTPLIMERVDLTKDVDAVADGNDIFRSKPDPEVFLLAAERLGLKPTECLVVEDASAGIEAGRRAGMAVFAIGPRERHPDVEHWADTLKDVSLQELIGVEKAEK